ncbi:phospholipase A2 inhibitor and Ly6 PLAUR domain-containing B-like isoform X1 [Podarcis lilfordi]|uniref:Phospholipase A2 inhibitor and Ly6 PLAUR domain-containing B-like isoform X1 n=1 Tax=Podarcis lilfordi TaxID=74358 RepID=A0AA35KPL5_9SAUR|nr:phospholipase A2 inhibitor and Ly6 PLAUR domain-containing B-like isoform X1 [Podarcis lilfordi]
METPLPICFLSIFIVTGASLECETCAGAGNTCNGPMETCSPGFDMCAVTLSEARLGMKMNSVVKHCAQSKSCNDGTSIINFGKTGEMLSQVFCCVGAKCKTMTPTLTPTRSKPNGKFCPACYAMNSECEEEWVECNGEEIYCLHVSGTTDLGTLAVKTTMKGCTNSPTCEELKEHSGSISGITVTSLSSCRPAGSTSGGHRIVPGSFGLFLAALAGLQFVMHLP